MAYVLSICNAIVDGSMRVHLRSVWLCAQRRGETGQEDEKDGAQETSDRMATIVSSCPGGS